MRVINLFAILLLVVGLCSAATVNFNGTVTLVNGSYATGANITLYNVSMMTTPPTSTLLNSTISASDGSWNLSFDNTTVTYLDFEILWNDSTPSYYMSNDIPEMPVSQIQNIFTSLNQYNISIALVPVAKVFINATNSSGYPNNFGISIRNMRFGSDLLFSMNTTNTTVNGKPLYLPIDQNYSAFIFQEDNLSIANETATFPRSVSISTSNLTNDLVGGTFYYTINFSETNAFVSGNMSVSGNTSAANSLQMAFYPLETDSIFYGSDSRPLRPSTGGDAFIDEVYNNYSVGLPAAPGINYLMFVVVNDSSGNYYGAIQNITEFTSNVSINLTLRPLIGPFIFTNYSQDVNSSKYTVQYNSSTGSLISTNSGSMLVTTVKDYNDLGTVNYTMLTQPNSTGVFIFPVVNNSNVTLEIFRMDSPPMQLSLNTSVNSTIINLRSMGMRTPSGDGLPDISVYFYRSNSTCDVLEPSSNCLITTISASESGPTDSFFNPMAFTLAGINISMRISYGTLGAIVQLFNVDLIASGPPDAELDSIAAEGASTSTEFNSFQRFGSLAPSVFTSAAIAMPYSDTEMDDSETMYALISVLYDEDWNQIWNATSATYGNSLGLNIPAAYQDYYNTSTLFNSSNRHPCSTTNQSNTCYVNTVANRIWVRIPHFSGGGYNYYGTPYTFQSSTGDSSSLSEVEITHEFDCETGEVVVTVRSGSSAIEGISVTLLGVGFGYSSSESTDSEGTALFTITSDGTYKILTSATSEYHSGSESDFSLALCEAEEDEEEGPETGEPECPTNECTTDEDCATDEVCVILELAALPGCEGTYTCEKIVGLCGYAENHEWISYECCEDSDCSEEQVCMANECVDLTEEDEEDEEEDSDDQASGTEGEEGTGEATEEEQDYSWMYLLGLVILVVVLVGGYFLLNKKK